MKINHRTVPFIFTLLIGLLMVLASLCSCERVCNPSNLEILNAHCEGQLTISQAVSGDTIYSKWSIPGSWTEIDLEQGNYRVYLDVDNQLHCDVPDLWIAVYLASEYTFCKIKLTTTP